MRCNGSRGRRGECCFGGHGASIWEESSSAMLEVSGGGEGSNWERTYNGL
jgi:hypothetical protein